MGIFLEGFGLTIMGVYVKPRPYGFDFICGRPMELLALMRSKVEQFKNDNRDTIEGRFSAWATHGQGFREKGAGPRLHVEVALDGECNVHIDSHGYVDENGEYNWSRSLEHGYWDLLADKVPGLFGSFGDRGQVGPMIRPIVDLEGKTRWVIGLTGHW